jgi:serine phosphatase RsbU (regulator of sigma subunit)/ligand-binding sensor domain-containing protein
MYSRVKNWRWRDGEIDNLSNAFENDLRFKHGFCLSVLSPGSRFCLWLTPLGFRILGASEEDRSLFAQMRLNSMKPILYTITLLLLFSQPHPSHAHNGAVAIAVPVEGITVDGDFSDWPEGMREYPTELPEYGVAPRDSADFQGWFRIGYNEDENALYVAVEVRDESLVIDSVVSETFSDDSDGCEVYVDIGLEKEDAPIVQHGIWGNLRRRYSFGIPGSFVNQLQEEWRDVEVEVQRNEGSHHYEWRISIDGMSKGEIELRPQTLLGFDVVVCDKDEDGSFSWMAWGPEALKFSPDRVGLVVLSGKEKPKLVVEIEKTEAPPQIDGDISDWSQVEWIRLAQDAPNMPPEISPWSGLGNDGATEPTGTAGTDADLSGSFALRWNEEWIYLAAQITDNVHDVLGGDREQWFLRDGISLYLDVPLDGDGIDCIQGDHSFSFVADSTYPDSGKWWRNGEIVGEIAPPETKLAVELDETGNYVLEAGIPMSALMESTPQWRPPFGDRMVGFMVIVTDADGKGGNPFGGQLVYGGIDDNDANWAILRFRPSKKARPPHFEFPGRGSSETGIGTIKGRIKWEDEEEGARLGRVRIQSLTSEELWVEVKTDSQGVYEVDLPTGEYRVEAGYRNKKTEKIVTAIKKDDTVRVEDITVFEAPSSRKRANVIHERSAQGAGKALSLDGVGDFMAFPPVWEYSPTEITVEAWYSYSGKGFYLLVNHGNNGVLNLDSNGGSVLLEDGDWYEARKRTFEVENTWYHTAITWKKGSSLQSFINGILEDKTEVPDVYLWDVRDSNLPSIGAVARGRSNQRYFRGLVDEVRIWDRALSNREIQANVHRTLVGNEDGLVGYWRFDQVKDDSLILDLSGYENHGVLVGDAKLVSSGARIWEGQRTGKIKGEVRWEDTEEGTTLGRVRIQSLTSKDIWVEVKTDSKGVYEADLSVGEYKVEAGYRGSISDHARVRVSHERDAVVAELSFADPPLGRRVVAGSGRRSKAEPGFRRDLWHTYNVSDGLPYSLVNVLTQDQDGNLWLGTYHGAYRFDGRVFTGFSTDDGLPNDNVMSIMQDRDGDLWFGTPVGVSRYDGYEFTNYTQEDGMGGGSVFAIEEDEGGNLWFGTGSGITRYDGTQFVPFDVGDGRSVGLVFDILEDSGGDLWFASSVGVSRYDGIKLEPFAQDEVQGEIRCIVEDQDRNIWFGSSEKGVYQYDGDGIAHFTSADGLVENAVRSMHQDQEGHLWIATFSGVSEYDGQRFITHTPQEGLSHFRITCIEEDREGYLWFGTHGGGISRYDGNRVAIFTIADGLASNHVRSVVEDTKGNLWFATYGGGASWYDGQQMRTLTVEDGLVSNFLTAVEEDADGDLWFGSPDGVSRYDGTRFSNFTEDSGLAGKGAWHIVRNCILSDSNGHLWFGSIGGGVTRYDGTDFVTFTEDDGLGNNNILSLGEDYNGNIWLGLDWGGLSRYDGDRGFTTFTDADGLAEDVAESILGDSDGNLWIGNSFVGLSRYDGEKFVTYNSKNGFAPIRVRSIMEDSRGHLWFGGWGEGIVRYDGRVFQALLPADGLPSGSIYDMLQDRNGDVWLATERGVVRYRVGETLPLIYLTDVVTDRRYGSVSAFKAPSSERLIAFEFGGNSLGTRLGQMLYVYRLKGRDKDWQQTRETRVEYTDLPVGEYIFEVQAVDRDLNYSEPVTVEVIIHPPYGQIVAWSVLGFSLLSLVFVSGYGIRRNRERIRAREEFAKEQKERLELQEKLNQELEEELQTAHNMQMGLMPTESPKITGFDISGRCLPATHVGGDFFQYFPISDNRLAISLADVTGHAMEAAVPVMMFSGILDTQMETGNTLEDLFARLNRSLHRNLDSRTFVCFTMGELDTATNKFRLSNGGCPYPYHYKAASEDISELQVDAYPLGVRAEATYPVIEIQLEPGDRIIFCSDGIIEAENSEEVMFGFERTAETIRKGCQDDLSAPQLLDYLIREVKNFTGETPQGDDQTVVVLAVERGSTATDTP